MTLLHWGVREVVSEDLPEVQVFRSAQWRGSHRSPGLLSQLPRVRVLSLYA